MEYNKFCVTVKEKVKEALSESVSVEVRDITKNNSVILQGLTINTAGENISPTIYLNDFYEAYEHGMTMDTIVNEVVRIYRENRIPDRMDVSFFTDFEKVKERIAFKLVNYEKNEDLLKTVPHIRFLDLAIVFYYLMEDSTMKCATILIHNDHAKSWGKDADELWEIAKENTPKLLNCEIKDIVEVLKDMLGQSGDDFSENDVLGIENSGGMFVLSNKSKVNGAACILYRDVLDEFADEQKADLYILPSSVHEVIILPAKNCDDSPKLKQMVEEVNDTQLEEQEILSDNVYYYSRAEKKVVLCS